MKKLAFLIAALGLTLSINSNSQDINSKIKIVPGSGTEYNISREEAERELHKLAKNSYMEDAWMYHKGKLIDIGIDESWKNIFPDTIRIFSTKYNSGDTIYIYHNHPRKNRNDRLSPPSELDYVADKSFKMRLNSNSKQVISSVFDGFGMWTYSSNNSPLIKEELIQDSIPTYPLLSESLRFAYKSSVHKKFRKNEIKKFVKNVEKTGLKLKYKKMK